MVFDGLLFDFLAYGCRSINYQLNVVDERNEAFETVSDDEERRSVRPPSDCPATLIDKRTDSAVDSHSAGGAANNSILLRRNITGSIHHPRSQTQANIKGGGKRQVRELGKAIFLSRFRNWGGGGALVDILCIGGLLYLTFDPPRNELFPFKVHRIQFRIGLRRHAAHSATKPPV